MAFLRIQLKIEFFRIYAANVHGADVTHRRDGQCGIEGDQVLFRGILPQLGDPVCPAWAIIIFRLESSANWRFSGPQSALVLADVVDRSETN